MFLPRNTGQSWAIFRLSLIHISYSVYEEIIKDNIAYDYLIQDRYLERDRIEEILALILETVCTKGKTIRIAGDDHPAELVKARFMKLNSEHIRFVLDCMQENTTKIRNIKQYIDVYKRQVRGASAPEARCGYRNPTLSSILATQMPCRSCPSGA